MTFEIEKLQAENASLRDLLKLAAEDLKSLADCCEKCLHGNVNEDICRRFDFDCKNLKNRANSTILIIGYRRRLSECF